MLWNRKKKKHKPKSFPPISATTEKAAPNSICLFFDGHKNKVDMSLDGEP